MTGMTVIHKKTINEKMVAITFDDGPNPIFTPQVLNIFREVGGKATFYMIGEQMEKHPDVVKAVLEEGHEIGNHTYTHPMLTELSPHEQKEELLKAEGIIEKLVGKKPATFRPPFFDFNEEVAEQSRELNYSVIGCVNGDSHDWEMPGVEFILDKTRPHIESGSILLFHDGFGDRSQTMEAVQTIVKELAEQDYQLVTVSELLKG